ncbi:Maf family nucleotide pyrophosphatase [Rhizosphaericola mali]|uniref:dTTP/UTP pyrophosphatase n=1 Tax=Rhizosphaericola mali TaxID=2545455 RepID=A0A5P2G3Y1_9BACT|nr:Maf family protein [Rhizosphaericola mali]QES87803.1 septum formation protein Maf [Rhizosphaericola mali]
MISNFPPIILASQSPRRKKILELANVPFDVVVSHSDENFPSELAPELVPVFIAKNKAIAVWEKINAKKDAIVIAADTVVIVDGNILGKPKDRAEAIAFLESMSGKNHAVVTGVFLLSKEKEERFFEETKVYFKKLTLEEIEYYVDRFQPYDKAGAYGIQEWIGLIGIEKIDGDFYNVMGLPANKLLQTLEAFIG